MAVRKGEFRIVGMTCTNCEKHIKNVLSPLPGVFSATASFPNSNAAVSFDSEKISEKEIVAAIENEGYKVKNLESDKSHSVSKILLLLLIVVALYFIIRYTVGFNFVNLIPKIDQTVSLAALFVIGLMTSVHCIAMCGGINITQIVGGSGRKSAIARPLLYNLGRVISYTVIGGIVGGLGSVLYLSLIIKGIIMLIAAVFMLLMSLSMLGWLPHLLVPRLPRSWSLAGRAGRGPFIVGLLNGLMPCGPLQAMQLYALSTGSILMGALSMLLFSLGTVPLTLGIGLILSLLKGNFTRIVTRVSAVLVLLMAVVMFVNATGFFGLSLFGAPSAPTEVAQGYESPVKALPPAEGYSMAVIKDGVQYVEGKLRSSEYPVIMVQKGIPVKFNLKAEAKDINGCNGSVIIPKFNIEKDLEAGDNIMEFTPKESGTIAYTCWMSMIKSKIFVVDSLEAQTASSTAINENPSAATSGGYCSSGSAARFSNGKIPVDDIAVAKIVDGKQEMTVTVNSEGYSPAVLVVQKSVALKIRFNPEEISSCNSIVVFADLDKVLYLSDNELETQWITPDKDIVFECGMYMLHGYVKAVDDINSIDLEAIKTEISSFKANSNLNISGCCGY